MDLLETITEKSIWFVVEGADSDVQHLYALWEALQFQEGVLYKNFLGADDQVRWRQLLVPRSLKAP